MILLQNLQGQSRSIAQFDRLEAKTVLDTLENYVWDDARYFTVNMSFEDFEVENPAELQTLAAQNIFAVDLVYSLFPKGKNFEALNQKRVEELLKRFPTLGQKPGIQWRWLGQKAVKDRAQAEETFHGFVIYYEALSEMKKIDYSQVPFPKLEAEVGIDYLKPLSLQRIREAQYVPKDSLVYRILKRNIPNWEEALIISDWTASMYPYGSQILVLMDQFPSFKKNIRAWAFFNDGDDKDFGEKVIGQTGGIYATQSQENDAIIALMKKVQKKGRGGYDSENDLEAILQMQRLCPEAKDIVLIADAKSYVRDLVLLPNLEYRLQKNGQRLHLILCGLEEGINPEYLEIARRSKASLHDAERDWSNWEQVEEGELIQLGTLTYEYWQGYFRRYRNPKKKRRP